jgi:hypothetical protein
LKQLAAIPLVRRTVLPVTASNGRNHAGTIEGKMNVPAGMLLKLFLSVDHLDRHKREIHIIRANDSPAWRESKTIWITGGRENALSYTMH